jgi:putative ABC transport system permease protein
VTGDGGLWPWGGRKSTKCPPLPAFVQSPGSFSALGVPLRQGRDFEVADTGDRPLVAIVNEALVRSSFGGQNPIGRTIYCLFDRADPMTIVGVVGDVRQRNPGVAPVPECYMPYHQHDYNSATLNILVRTASAPASVIPSIRQAAMEVSPDVPLSFTTMNENVATGLRDSRFRALLFSIFAALAVCLAMAGVYGVMAVAVTERTKEIGLRMALGASQASVLSLVLRQGLTLVASGLAVGLVAATAAARLLTTVLFEVRPIDGQVYLGVAASLACVALIAGYAPARRASALDPARVLKLE